MRNVGLEDANRVFALIFLAQFVSLLVNGHKKCFMWFFQMAGACTLNPFNVEWSTVIDNVERELLSPVMLVYLVTQ